ncbi:hypothetical protein BDV3_004078 [Batrachochytrium dendrobatidis]|nr:hypothetical protein O5D80_002098 [Batrachochytrium dendrobatidis]KAK5669974.1 hypothetical protein QVD99_004346 [Batrachochytrium dendrobatidis]
MSTMVATSDFKTVVKGIKLQQQGHIAKLQLKSEAEQELLESVKEYMQKRAELELQYSKSLEKLGKTLQARKFRKFLGTSTFPLGSAIASTTGTTPTTQSLPGTPSLASPPEFNDSDSVVHDRVCRDTYQALSSLLIESEHQAKFRLQTSEKLVVEIADVIKDFNKEKSATTKRHLDYCIKFQQEMWLLYEEIDKLKLLYEKAAREENLAQKKYDDAAKRPKSGLQALKNLVTGKDAEERLLKLKSKWKTKTRQLNNSRNDYLLSLEGINAMQSHYYKDDMTALMEKIDGNFYTTFSSMLHQFTSLESSVAASLKSGADLVDTEIKKVDRKRDVELFLKDYQQIFHEQAPFLFDMATTDEHCDITVDESSKTPLGQRLGELCVRDETLSTMLNQREKELIGVVQMAEAYAATPQFGNAATPLDQKLEIKNAIDLLKAQRIRTSVQIKTLKSLGIEPIMPVIPEDNPALPNFATKKNDAVAASDYTPINPEEVTLTIGNLLEILTADHEGRTKVKVIPTGAIGFVPTACITISQGRRSSLFSSDQSQQNMTVSALEDYEAMDDGELSFKVGDVIECTDGIFEDEEWWDGHVLRTGQVGTFQVRLTKGWESVAAATVNKTKLMRRASSRRITMTSGKTRNGDCTGASSQKIPTARALYSYEATCDGELTIEAGEILVIKSKETGSDDWWEGEGKNGCGQFPVNYVQMIESDQRGKEGISQSKLGLVSEIEQVRALYDFTPSSPGELTFKSGDIIKVTQSSDPDWWDGELDGVVGAFPARYVTSILTDLSETID